MKMKQISYIRQLITAATFMAATSSVFAVPFTLTNGPGDGTVSLGVDGFGSFGSSVGSDSSNAVYDPVGAIGPAGTSYESGIAFGIGGSRTFLTSGDIGGSGGLSNPTVTGSSTSGSSMFSYGGLSFSLIQSLTTLSTGTQLDQVYTITNSGPEVADFELVRYLDGDLLFDGSLVDGGGRFILDGREVLFETDSATGSSTSTTFVGISAEGGTIPTTGRYEIDSFAGLRGRIVAGTALDDIISGDGADVDQFIDTGAGYDVTLALTNIFSLDSGATTTYTTSTIFGSGTPASGGGGTASVPEPTTLALMGLGLASLGFRRKRKSL